MIAYSGSNESMNANVRKLAIKKFLLTSVGALFLATGAAHAEDTLTMRGVDWKCRNGMVVRFDQVGGKREEGGSETLIITGIPHGLNNLHITCGKRGCPVLNGKRCAIQD